MLNPLDNPPNVGQSFIVGCRGLYRNLKIITRSLSLKKMIACCKNDDNNSDCIVFHCICHQSFVLNY